ncbi:MAG: OmpA family protein [Pseudomonadota bacterium]
MTFTKTPLLLGAIASLGLAGCVQQSTGDPNRTANGALIGAGLGAGIGAIVGDGDAEEILAGAAIGGLAGAGIGAQLDRQAAELRRELDGRVTIVNTGRELVVTLPQDITFATESAAVRPDLQDDIGALGRNLLNYPNTTVQVIGHTDNTGSAEFNQGLSEQRALSVSSLLQRQGVPGSRIAAIGRGEAQPIASNNTPDGRQANRRVEIIITPQQR